MPETIGNPLSWSVDHAKAAGRHLGAVASHVGHEADGLVLPFLLFRWAFAALLLDLLVRFGAAAYRRRRLARTDLLGHVAFVFAAVALLACWLPAR